MTMLDTIRNAAASVLPRFDVSAAYVFGSQARGNAASGSDVELRIVRGPSLDFGDLDKIRLEFSSRCGRDVDVVCARDQDFDAAFPSNLKRGQVLVYVR